MSKIVIIGAGHVGSHCAYALAIRGIADEIVLLDIDSNKANAQAQDIADASCYFPRDITVRGGGYDDCRNADIVVLAAGAPRTPVQLPDGRFVPPPRLTLLGESVRTMQHIIPRLERSGFDGILIGITNPADVIINFVYKQLKFPPNRVFSTGTGLDTARLKRLLSEASGFQVSQIGAIAMGEHGDSQIAPYSQMTIDELPLPILASQPGGQYDFNYQDAAQLAKITGGRIISGKGTTEFGIGTVLSDIVKAVLYDEKRVMPVSARLDGQYGVSGIYAGVPAVIGKNGVESIVELPLTDQEIETFAASCAVIRSFVEKADAMVVD